MDKNDPNLASQNSAVAYSFTNFFYFGASSCFTSSSYASTLDSSSFCVDYISGASLLFSS